VERSCERGNELSGFIKCWETIDGLQKWKLWFRVQTVLEVHILHTVSIKTTCRNRPSYVILVLTESLRNQQKLRKGTISDVK
jgi:hypothetical protein